MYKITLIQYYSQKASTYYQQFVNLFSTDSQAAIKAFDKSVYYQTKVASITTK